MALSTIDTSSISALGYGFKNRILNGGMQIDQRNAGASVTISTALPYTLDRWSAWASQASKYSVQQNAGSVTPPAGFSSYLGVTSLSAYSVLTGDYNSLVQPIEGLNIADLSWGTASAATVTLSFWVRSSLTGTFGGALKNSASNRSYPFTYTISASNTWEQKSITIAGDTSGTWLTTNGIGIYVQLGLGVGSTYSGTAGSWAGANYVTATGATSVVGTSGATFYITGVQLEKGTVATSFDWRPYGTELALCQRYFLGLKAEAARDICGSGWAVSATDTDIKIPFPVWMRTEPSYTFSNLELGDSVNSPATVTSLITSSLNNSKYGVIDAVVASGLTTYRSYNLRDNGAGTGYLFVSAEL